MVFFRFCLIALALLPAISGAQTFETEFSGSDAFQAAQIHPGAAPEDFSLQVNLLDEEGRPSPLPPAPDAWEEPTHGTPACGPASVAVIGTKLWQLVTSNVSISESSVKSMVAHVLPEGVREPRELSSFPSKKVQKLEVILLNNILGIEMFKVVVQLSFDYGASYRGSGQYLANLTMIPVEVKAFGAKGSVKAEVLSAIFRSGNVAALSVVVKSEVRGALDKVEKAYQFEARGNGDLVGY